MLCGFFVLGNSICNTGNTVTSKFVIESFWQQASNCVTMSYCKAMLLTYGFRKSFSRNKIGKGVLITLQDKSSIFFTKSEIKQLNKGHGIYFKKYSNRKKAKDSRKIKAFVEIFFAIVVKRMQLIGYSGKEFTRSRAIKTLTKDGLTSERFHELIGVKRKKAKRFLKKDIKELIKKKAVLMYNERHITCASHGLYNDNTGTASITDKIPLLQGLKAKAWYELK